MLPKRPLPGLAALGLAAAAVLSGCGTLTGIDPEGTPTDHPASGQLRMAPSDLADPGVKALAAAIENVPAAEAHAYDVRDDRGAAMDTLKIIAGPRGGYLGVYHTRVNGTYVTRVATSQDLTSWQFRAELDRNASQPAVAALSDGGFLVVEEADNEGSGGTSKRWLRFRHYPTLDALLAGRPDRTFDVPHTLTPEDSGAEGTPNIYSADVDPDLSHSRVEVGLHYLVDGVDREARGTLVDFSTWTTHREAGLDTTLTRLGAAGKHGDRDAVELGGTTYTLLEAEDKVGGTWQVYLRDRSSVRPLHIRTHGGSRSLSNPTLTALRGPGGQPVLVVAVFVRGEGAAHGESGELVYDVPLLTRKAVDGVAVAAAGDIACPSAELTRPGRCGQAETADLVARLRPDAVLALGDLQYEHGSLESFKSSYGPTWGRFKSTTYPVIGNHDYAAGGATGYFDYFGRAAGAPGRGYYSFDLGAWHLVALNSECAAFGGCGPGSPQDRWLVADLAAHPSACTLAFWHGPLFTSGSEGPSPEVRIFWERLYAMGADVVLNGHDHDYERFAPLDPAGRRDPEHGVREFVVGTGGKNLHRFARQQRGSVIRYNDSFGVLRMVLRPHGFAWAFYPVDGASPVDSGSATCH